MRGKVVGARGWRHGWGGGRPNKSVRRDTRTTSATPSPTPARPTVPGRRPRPSIARWKHRKWIRGDDNAGVTANPLAQPPPPVKYCAFFYSGFSIKMTALKIGRYPPDTNRLRKTIRWKWLYILLCNIWNFVQTPKGKSLHTTWKHSHKKKTPHFLITGRY